ncbi:MAG: hypothetical protein HKN16_12840, partial [Saprospiraceae bacterium]|nr:hypothetical protein [Saprospiraceae bacterium]
MRSLSTIVSILAHPLLVLTYMLIILMSINPFLFGYRNLESGFNLILIVFFSTFFIPAVAVLLMKMLGLVDDVTLTAKQQRTGPYIITGVFYLWMFRTLVSNPNIPDAFKIFILGAVISLFLAFVINIFSKISMHTTGMGGLIGMLLICLFYYQFPNFWLNIPGAENFQLDTRYLLMGVLVLSGLVGTSRLFLKAHSTDQVFGGYFIGLIG